MSFRIRAISLDLDDTLWPFAPIGARIERTLDAWFREHSPATAAMFPIEKMRALRERICAEEPHLLELDPGALRRAMLEHALRASGGPLHRLDDAYDAFYAERNKVEFYPDALPALARLRARLPLVSLSNGNADLQRIGIAAHFVARLHSREHGISKPATAFFHAACAALDLPPQDVLHVGDHPDLDVVGALRAGMRACWLNRENAQWPHADVKPDLEFATLTELADWLDENSR